MEKFLKAVGFAVTKHDGQHRKNVGQKVPYVTHPLRVAAILEEAGFGHDEDLLVAAVLHDTLEDTQTTYEELVEAFGADIASTVAELTDDKTLSKVERREAQVAKAPGMSFRARLIKVADKLDNVRSVIETPPEWSRETKLEYAEAAERVVRAANLWGSPADVRPFAASLVGWFNAAVAGLRSSLA